jgi:hypothetical protein
MRSQVQVLAGPLAILAGHSAVGSEPAAPAASLGRAGAARPSRRHAHRPFRTRPPGAAGPMTTTHRGRPTSPGRQPRHRCGNLALQPAPESTAQPLATALCTPAWPAWSLSRSSAAARTPPGPGPPPTPLTNATSAASPAAGPARPSIEPLHGAAAHRDSTRCCSDGCPPPRPGPHRRRLRGDEMDASGRMEADSSRLDAGRVDTGRPDTDGRTPDGLDTGCAGHHTAGHWTAGPPDPDDGTAEWTPHGGHRLAMDRRQASCLADHGDNARPLDAGWTLRRGGRPSGRPTNQDSSAAGLPGRARPPPRPSAAGATPPSSWRLGALLSSDDYGSSVEREAHGQVL